MASGRAPARPRRHRGTNGAPRTIAAMTDERRVATDPSRTAETTATQRAAERHMPPEHRLLDDAYAQHFVQSASFRVMLRSPRVGRFTLRMRDRRFPGLHAIILLRAAF